MEEWTNSAPINVAVFIDYENVYRNLLQEHKNVLRLAFFEKLRKWCAEHNRRIVRTVVYCNFDNLDLHESYHQSRLQSYGVETVHTSNQGKNYADLKITIDVLTAIYSNNNIDEFFIVSNDKDMTPLLNTIRENKRNVAVITTGSAYNPALCEFADNHISLEEICQSEVEHKVIDDIRNTFLEKYKRHVTEKIEKYSQEARYSHNELMYTITNELKYTKVMSYEMVTIIKELYNAGEIFLYKYMFRGAERVSMAPSGVRQEMISKGIIQETDIIDSYDFDTIIDDLYKKALPQN